MMTPSSPRSLLHTAAGMALSTVFVEVARDIRRHSLLEPTLVIGLTGGSMGYLPHPRGYDEGGYEATFASARYDPRTSLLWSDAATLLLNHLLEDKTESP